MLIEIIKKAYQALLLVNENFADVVYSSKDKWGESELEMTLDNIDALCEK